MKKKKMTKEMVENLVHILITGGDRHDFEETYNFDSEKLDNWFDRLMATYLSGNKPD